MSALTTNVPPSEQMPALAEELHRLLEADLRAEEFFASVMDRLVARAKALGGAIWQRTEIGFDLAHAKNWHALGLESIPDGASCHLHALQVAAERDRALWVPAKSGRKIVGVDQQAANLSHLGLLFAPVVMDKGNAGLVEIWIGGAVDGPERRELARLVTETAGFVAAFLHKHQLRTLQEQQQLWLQLETFSRQIHSSLDPKGVAQAIAGEGRRLIGCDQLAVAVRLSALAEIAAISGTSAIEPGSPHVQALQQFAEAVLQERVKVVYHGQRDETLCPSVAHGLDAYLAKSGASCLVALPLLAADGVDCGVLVAESHDPGLRIDAFVHRVETIANHAAGALANARQVARLPLHKFSQTLAKARDGLNGRNAARLGLYAAPILILIAVLALVKIPLRLEAKGQLVPVQRQIVFAPLHGKIVEVKARAGDRVDRGQELLLLEDLDTQLQIDQLAIKIASAEQRIALLSEQIGKSVGSEERNTLTRERITQEYEMRKAMAERDILLQASRSPRKAAVVAPLAGKVVTFDVQEQLLGKTVKPGDALLRVAAVKGAWEIELQIPERNLGPIREGLKRGGAGSVEVDLLLANQPHRTYKGVLLAEGLGGETAVKDNNIVLPARVRIADAELAAMLESLPVGLEVRSKVNCGPRPIGEVWFHEVWEFFYEHVLF